MSKSRILIVEDDFLIAMDLVQKLTNLGYQITDQVSSGEAALTCVEQNCPDLIIMDIRLNGNWTGIEAAQKILKHHFVPIIYLTDAKDKRVIDQAIATRPAQFHPKPFDLYRLDIEIKVALSKYESVPEQVLHLPEPAQKDSVLIKNNGDLIQLYIKEIFYVKADRSYCSIKTEEEEYWISRPMNWFLKVFPHNDLVQVHRSYAVNIHKIKKITREGDIVLKGLDDPLIPVSPTYRQNLLDKL